MNIIYLAFPVAYVALVFALVSLATHCRERYNDLEVDYCATLASGKSGELVDRIQYIRKRAAKQAKLDFILCYLGGFAVALILIPLLIVTYYNSNNNRSLFFLFVYEFTVIMSLFTLGYCWKKERHQLDWHCDK